MNQNLKDQIGEVVAKFETKYGVRCAVVRNIYNPITFGQGILSLVLIVVPPKGVGDADPDYKKICQSLFNEWNETDSRLEKRKWRCKVFLGLSDWSIWFKRYKDKPGRFPLSDMADGAILISEVVYGQEIMDEARKQAMDFFGNQIISFWETEANRQIKERAERMEKMQREHNEYVSERIKLLNKYELEELREMLLHLAEVCPKKGIRLIVAFDGSGRPIGKAIRWFFNGTVTIIHMDPHQLKKLDFTNKREVHAAVEIFQREFPSLYALLRKSPESVLFVDDQTGYGVTYESLKKFVKIISGGNALAKLATMSQWSGNNAPSWLRNREIQGIELAPEGSFTAVDKPTVQSEEFYNALHAHVLRWKSG